MPRTKWLFFGQRLMGWHLVPLSWLYAFAVFCRNWLYDKQWLSITRVPRTVVSVGNLVAGGTGKTPFVHMLARRFAHRKVAILSRGYGEMADEALLLAKRLPHVKVYVGKNRAALAKIADADLLILDDGFQHRKLHRDFDIVLVRDEPEHYLPWGFLRDSPKRLKDAEVFRTEDLQIRVTRILDLQGKQILSIQGWKVAIFSGIARPERFKKTIEGLGAQIIAEIIWGDHERADLSKLPTTNALICTEKDVVKLPPTHLPIYYLEIEMEVARGEDRWEKLIEKIDQKIDNSARL